MRKYLDDIHNNNRPDNWGEEDSRQEKWAEEREIYGFDSRETWNLDYSFYLWLYEHLKMFVEVADINLDYHKFDYDGKEYTQKQLIDMMLERLEFFIRM